MGNDFHSDFLQQQFDFTDISHVNQQHSKMKIQQHTYKDKFCENKILLCCYFVFVFSSPPGEGDNSFMGYFLPFNVCCGKTLRPPDSLISSVATICFHFL